MTSLHTTSYSTLPTLSRDEWDGLCEVLTKRILQDLECQFDAEMRKRFISMEQQLAMLVAKVEESQRQIETLQRGPPNNTGRNDGHKSVPPKSKRSKISPSQLTLINGGGSTHSHRVQVRSGTQNNVHTGTQNSMQGAKGNFQMAPGNQANDGTRFQ